MMSGERDNASKQNETVATLANAIELGTQVIMAVAGNNIGNTINGEVVTPDALRSTMAAKIQQGLSRYMEVSQ